MTRIRYYNNSLLIHQDMSTKYNYEPYTITVDFQNDFQMAITASDLFSGDIFINQSVTLTKIKKDTVIAALTRKNQKNMSCKFNLVDVQPKKLIIAFEVAFDFLPTFTEYVSLDQLEKKGTGLNKVESAELRSDIEELQKLVNNISCKESYYTTQISNSISGKGDVFSKELDKGSYLLEISGHFTCATGNKHDLVWTVNVEGNKHEITTCLYTNGGYGYPFSFRKEFILVNRGKVEVTVSHKSNQSFNIATGIVSLSPMIKTN